MGWIACMHLTTCMLLDPLHAINNTAHHVCSVSAARMDPQLVLAQFHPWVHVAPTTVIVPVATHWTICAASCSSWVVASAHPTPSLFHLLPSRDLHVVPSLHTLSLQIAFTISGSAWSYNFVPPLCCQQPSSCIHCIRFICCVRCIRYAAFSWCSWCCSLWCCCLMSLSTNNLMSSWVGKLIDTWSTASPSVLLTMSSSLLSWKPLYLYCWEADEHLRYQQTSQHS